MAVNERLFREELDYLRRYGKLMAREKFLLPALLAAISVWPWGRMPPWRRFATLPSPPDRSGKFMLCINNLSLERYLTFLPDGEDYLPLTTFVAFVLRDQLAWDLRLGLAPGEADGMRLGDERHAQLGRTCFIGKSPREPFVTRTVRQ